MAAETASPGFAVTHGKGFHITFENGWTVSVQFGRGNYCSNRDFAGPYGSEVPKSHGAEIAAWDENGNWHEFEHDEVKGWQSPAQVLEFMNEIAALPANGGAA